MMMKAYRHDQYAHKSEFSITYQNHILIYIDIDQLEIQGRSLISSSRSYKQPLNNMDITKQPRLMKIEKANVHDSPVCI